MPGERMEADPPVYLSAPVLGEELGLTLVRATEAAALACGRLLGKGDQDGAKAAASAAMHQALDETGINSLIALGPGDETLTPGLQLGSGPCEIDLAVYPVEGASLVARGLPNAVSMVVAAQRGGFPELPPVSYMEKMVAGPLAHGAVDLTDTVVDNLLRIAFSRDARISDLTVAILDRPRHHQLVEDVRAAGARILSLADGDIGAALLATWEGTGIDCAMGIGGVQEAVMTAAAVRCLGGDVQCRLWPRNEEEQVLAGDLASRLYNAADLVPGEVEAVITGITGGPLLEGVRYGGAWTETTSLVLSSRSGKVRLVKTRHRQHVERPR
jgi:fructose-1,6-bisphosphatase II